MVHGKVQAYSAAEGADGRHPGRGEEAVQREKGRRIRHSAGPQGDFGHFQENNFAIAADDLAQETRNFRQDVAEDEDDALLALAKAWNDFDGCSLATDPEKPKGRIILDAVKKHQADAVIVAMMKFCDPEEFDFPVLKEEFEAAGVKYLQIEVDQESEAYEQIKTRIQTFAEIL